MLPRPCAKSWVGVLFACVMLQVPCGCREASQDPGADGQGRESMTEMDAAFRTAVCAAVDAVPDVVGTSPRGRPVFHYYAVVLAPSEPEHLILTYGGPAARVARILRIGAALGVIDPNTVVRQYREDRDSRALAFCLLTFEGCSGPYGTVLESAREALQSEQDSLVLMAALQVLARHSMTDEDRELVARFKSSDDPHVVDHAEWTMMIFDMFEVGDNSRVGYTPFPFPRTPVYE